MDLGRRRQFQPIIRTPIRVKREVTRAVLKG